MCKLLFPTDDGYSVIRSQRLKRAEEDLYVSFMRLVGEHFPLAPSFFFPLYCIGTCGRRGGRPNQVHTPPRTT